MLIQKLRSIYRLLITKKKRISIPDNSENEYTKKGNTTLLYQHNRSSNLAGKTTVNNSENDWWIN